jgi:hypothetical protein
MAIWALSDAGLNAQGGQILTSSLLTTVTAGAANALGGWAMLHAGAPFPVSGVVLHLGKAHWAAAASNTQALLNLGIGASGQESVIVSDLAFGGALAFSTFHIPINIPIGARIAVQLRSAVASKSTTMGIRLYGGGLGLEGGHRAITYGAVTASSMGTVITAPTAANTAEGVWVPITTSTTLPIRWLILGLSAPNTTLATAVEGLLDIGVGAAGSEREIITDLPFSVSANEELNVPRPLTFPVSIPAGARVSARWRGTGTTSASAPTLTLTGIA